MYQQRITNSIAKVTTRRILNLPPFDGLYFANIRGKLAIIFIYAIPPPYPPPAGDTRCRGYKYFHTGVRHKHL